MIFMLQSLSREPTAANNSLGRKQEEMTVKAKAKYDGQPRQQAKISGLLYNMCDDEAPLY